MPASPAKAGWSGQQDLRDDLRELAETDDGSIAHNLLLRYQGGKRFTYLGGTLFSLCGGGGRCGKSGCMRTDAADRRHYREYNVVDLEPHPYGICSAALSSMCGAHWNWAGHPFPLKDWENQAIVISGESGSGKSSLGWDCASFFTAELGGRRAGGAQTAARVLTEAFTGFSVSGQVSSSALLQTNMFFQVSRSGLSLAGMSFAWCVMDHNRILGESAGFKQTFSVMSQLMAAPKDVKRKFCGLPEYCGDEEVSLLYPFFTELPSSSSSGSSFNGRLASLAGTRDALRAVGMDGKQISGVFSMIGAIANLAHMDFGSCPSEGKVGEVSSTKGFGLEVVNANYLTSAASLLHCDPEDLSSMFLNILPQENETSDSVTIPASLKQARYYRDALCRELYGTVCAAVLGAINAHSNPENMVPERNPNVALIVGLGFNAPQMRGGVCNLEDLCRHFTEEVILAKFLTDVACTQALACNKLQLESTDADEELPDNFMIIRSFDGPSGAFEALRDLDADGRNSDFLQQTLRDSNNRDIFLESGGKNSLHFIVRHSAGDFEYSAEDLSGRNWSRDGFELLSKVSAISSGHPILPGSGESSSPRAMLRQWSAGEFDSHQYKCCSSRVHSNMSNLLTQIKSARAHHIRCIKVGGAGVSDSASVTRQVKYCGVSATLQYWKLQFPVSMDKAAFFARYEGFSSIIDGALTGADGACIVTCGSMLMRKFLADTFERKAKASVEWAACIIQRSFRKFRLDRWEKRRRVNMAREEIYRIQRSALQRQESNDLVTQLEMEARATEESLARKNEEVARLLARREEQRAQQEILEQKALELAKLQKEAQKANEEAELLRIASSMAVPSFNGSIPQGASDLAPDSTKALCDWRLDLLPQAELLELMRKPLSPSEELRCRVVRGHGGNIKQRLYPSHYIYFESQNPEDERRQLMMRATKQSLKNCYYRIAFDGPMDDEQQYLGKLSSSRGSRHFKLLDHNCDRVLSLEIGEPTPGSGEASRKAKVSVLHANEQSSLASQKCRWDEDLRQYVLDFPRDRPVLSSIKNLILEVPRDGRIDIALRFGRAGSDEFILDISWPLSPLQAFACALASLESTA